MKKMLVCFIGCFALLGCFVFGQEGTISTDLPAVPTDATISTDNGVIKTDDSELITENNVAETVEESVVDPEPIQVQTPTPIVEEEVIDVPCPCENIEVRKINAPVYEPISVYAGYQGDKFVYRYNGPNKKIYRSFDRCTGERVFTFEHKLPCKKVVIEKRVKVEPVKWYKVEKVDFAPCYPCDPCTPCY